MYNSMSPLEALLNLCIDDGVPGRGHRVNIFKTTYYYTGVATAMHSVYTSETVTTFAGAWTAPTYTSPDITVPRTMAAYTGFAAWDSPSACASANTPAEESARTMGMSLLVAMMAAVTSVFV